MKNRICIFILLVIVGCLCVSCAADRTVDPQPPTITLDQSRPIYQVKVGQTLTIAPVVKNAGDKAVYLWRIDDIIVGREIVFTYAAGEDPGAVFVNFSVETAAGKAEQEIRIDVIASLIPEILLAVPEGGFSVVAEETLKFTPEVLHAESAQFVWMVNDERQGDQKDFTFSAAETGTYKLALTVTNEDGASTLDFNVNVCAPEQMPFEWMFETEVYNISIGRTAFIRPYWIKNAFDAVYSWVVDDGEPVQTGASCLYAYTPEIPGKYTVEVTMKNRYAEHKKTFVVTACLPIDPRPITAASKELADHGYFFLPAPSQHVNRGTNLPAYQNQEQVNAAIYDSPRSTEYGGTLGAWGGYLVVGFDHSVTNSGGYDLEIEGNAFSNSSEPGIVWVMQDENGDGRPNDTWYELKGSAYGKEGYMQDYAVTYYKGADNKPVVWVDNQGNTGTVDYLQVHTPPTIYPRWLSTESYTLVGSRLPVRVKETSPGYWENGSYEWGYVDNWSEIDMFRKDDDPHVNRAANHLKISDAVTYDKRPAELPFIDFVKIQTGVNAKVGWLGEISTEVVAIRDYNMLK